MKTYEEKYKGLNIKDIKLNVNKDNSAKRGGSPTLTIKIGTPKVVDIVKSKLTFSPLKSKEKNSKETKFVFEKKSPDKLKQSKIDNHKVDLNNNNIINFFSNLKNINIKYTHDINKSKERRKSNSPLRFNNIFNTNIKKDIPISQTANIAIIKNDNTFYSVKEYSYHEEKNGRFRNTMEDFSKIIDKYMNDSNKGFFSLYDGHGGTEPVIYVKDRMPDILSRYLSKEISENSFTLAFQKADDEMKMCNSENIGCTACVCLICNDKNGKVFYCANVGDSKCVIVYNNIAKFITQDHKCTNSTEVDRVRECGGIVFNGRVFGQLMLTRALGDHAMKSYGVISTPFVSRNIIDDATKYAVIASDGIWDVIGEEEVFKMSTENNSADDLCRALVKDAIEKGSKDNISCIVIRF